jgi:hypothetical protein
MYRWLAEIRLATRDSNWWRLRNRPARPRACRVRAGRRLHDVDVRPAIKGRPLRPVDLVDLRVLQQHGGEVVADFGGGYAGAVDGAEPEEQPAGSSCVPGRPVRAPGYRSRPVPRTGWDASGRARRSCGAAFAAPGAEAFDGVGDIGHEAAARSRISTAVSSICAVLVNQSCRFRSKMSSSAPASAAVWMSSMI